MASNIGYQFVQRHAMLAVEVYLSKNKVDDKRETDIGLKVLNLIKTQNNFLNVPNQFKRRFQELKIVN